MLSPHGLRDVPILLVDIVGYTSVYDDAKQRRDAIAALQRVVSEAGRVLFPYFDVWKKWTRHGTGDGYYFLLDAIPPQVVAAYALLIRDHLAAHQRDHGRDLPLRVRMVLAHGDVDWVDDQISSDAFNVAARVIDDVRLKEHARALAEPAVIAATKTFHYALERDLRAGASELPVAVAGLTWTPFRALDKHGDVHDAYVLGHGWDEKPAPGEPPTGPRRLRITILLGHSLRSRLPEAIDLARIAVDAWRGSGLHVEVRIDSASEGALRREAGRGCDLLFFYGHGSDDGRLAFVEGPRSYSELVGVLQGDAFFRQLSAFVVFACHGTAFAKDLPCAWVAFDRPILREAPKGFVHALAKSLGHQDFAAAVESARASCAAEMESPLAKQLRTSEEPGLPALCVGPGTPIVTRLSAGLAARVRLAFDGVVIDNVRYPDHDHFVGRTEQLRQLLDLPSRGADRKLQRVVWVHGSAGLGKTALLREAAVQVRDLVFHEDDEPISLVHVS
ncbi:MAG: hypothetical protein HY744_04845 [Deltaproteobacteria bacterium]|nr:hypothetical protein [Deltaproteobacteria bacterium]